MTLRYVWAVALLGATAAQAQAFCDKVKALANAPAVAAAHWGVSVTALDGTVLCSLNEAQLFRPASNNKLFTMAAGLALLGPERRFITTVVAEGDLTGGLLHGNLRLVGGGDANFGSTDVPYVEPSLRPKGPVQEPATIKDIEDLADQIYAKGVRTISGDVEGSDGYFIWEPYPKGWEIDDLNADYGAPVSALTIHDNALEIDIAAAPFSGSVPVPSFAPAVPYYRIEGRPQAVSGGEGCGRISLDRAFASRVIDVEGEIPLQVKLCKLHTAIEDPAEYAAIALKLALKRRGVQIGGVAVAQHTRLPGLVLVNGEGRPLNEMISDVLSGFGDRYGCSDRFPILGPGPITLATHQSPSLGSDLTYTVKASDNLHAEILLRNLGAVYSCAGTSLLKRSLGVVSTYLSQIGIRASDFVLYDGSGLSGHDLIAPRAFTQLLVYAAKQKWFDTFKGALPVGGVDGTLASRFGAPGSKLAGKVFAKTETLGESRALSGYVTAASGKTVVFSVMVDNHPPGTTADRVAMDRMVEAIAAGN